MIHSIKTKRGSLPWYHRNCNAQRDHKFLLDQNSRYNSQRDMSLKVSLKYANFQRGIQDQKIADLEDVDRGQYIE